MKNEYYVRSFSAFDNSKTGSIGRGKSDRSGVTVPENLRKDVMELETRYGIPLNGVISVLDKYSNRDHAESLRGLLSRLDEGEGKRKRLSFGNYLIEEFPEFVPEVPKKTDREILEEMKPDEVLQIGEYNPERIITPYQIEVIMKYNSLKGVMSLINRKVFDEGRDELDVIEKYSISSDRLLKIIIEGKRMVKERVSLIMKLGLSKEDAEERVREYSDSVRRKTVKKKDRVLPIINARMPGQRKRG